MSLLLSKKWEKLRVFISRNPFLNNCLSPHLNLLSQYVANGDKVGQRWSKSMTHSVEENLIDNGGIVVLWLPQDDRDELSEEFFCRSRNIASLFQGCFDEDEERRQSSKKLSCLSKLWCKVIWPSFFEQMLVKLGGNRHLNCPFRL